MLTREDIRNKIFHGDCLHFMNKVEPGSVDLVLTSPPYNTARAGKSPRALKHHEGRYISYEDDKTPEEYIAWTIDIFNGFDKILAKNGCILYNISYSSEEPSTLWLTIAEIIQKTNLMVADCITWKKGSALPNNVSHNKLTRIVEYVFVICRKEEFHTFNGNKRVKSVSKTGQKYYENVFNFIEARNNDSSVANHKATYSSELCIKLMDIYAKPGSIIYDPFTGTGTTGVACKQLGHDFVGTEITQEYVDYATERLNNV